MAYIQGEVYIADGFADDCDELMHRCLQAGTLTFEIFSYIWKDMQLSCIFQGRSSGAELAELSEEVLHIAKHYMVADTSNFEESVAGLFLVYSLMHLQPYSNFASLRIVQEDLRAIERIEFVARRDRRQDVLYVLGSVLIQGPVQYHAVVRERGMEYSIRKYLEGYTTVDKLGIRPKGVFYRQNTELDILRELRNLTVRYTQAKENIPGVPRDDRNLNYLDANFATDLGTSLKNIITGIIHNENGGESSNNDDAIKNIKNKAMKAKVKPIRHRVGVAEKSLSIKRNASTTSNDKPSKSKDEPTERKNNNRAIKRRRKASDSSSASNCSVKGSELGTADELESTSDEELDLTKFDKTNGEDEMSVDLELGTLDQALRLVCPPQEIEISPVHKLDQPSTSGLNFPSTSTADTKKRDLKKTILKSRFKRMGMLNVANFDTK